jgi:N-acetyl-1-D-myo-inositol-2-amino-2-deoxy-alpha-D-glucopyranoside deacetylase
VSLRLLCVHPHPDDESIACGGLIVRSVRAGHDVTVVTCTDGAEGENQAGIELGGREMADVRHDEMADAIIALGAPRHRWLGYRDSGMAGEPANDHPDAFHGAELDEAAARLAAMIRELRPHVVVSDDEHGTYGHPDHIKAHLVTNRALELAADPAVAVAVGGEAWQVAKRYVHTLSRERLLDVHRTLRGAGLESPFGDADFASADEVPFGADGASVTATVDVMDVLDAKRAGMAAHRSQIGEDSFFLNTPPELGPGMFGVEDFQLLFGDAEPGPDGLEDDVFAGLGGAA